MKKLIYLTMTCFLVTAVLALDLTSYETKARKDTVPNTTQLVTDMDMVGIAGAVQAALDGKASVSNLTALGAYVYSPTNPPPVPAPSTNHVTVLWSSSNTFVTVDATGTNLDLWAVIQTVDESKWNMTFSPDTMYYDIGKPPDPGIVTLPTTP